MPWPTRSDTVTRTFELPVPLPEAHARLTDPLRLPIVHPLIVGVIVTADGVDGSERFVRFDVDERVPLLGLSVPSRYRGEVRWHAGAVDRLTLVGWSFPAITLESTYTLTAREDGRTRVDQEMTVRGPWPLGGFGARTARIAHDEVAVRWAALP